MDGHIKVHTRATRLQGKTLGHELSFSHGILIFLSFCFECWVLFCFSMCVCNKKHISLPFHVSFWIYLFLSYFLSHYTVALMSHLEGTLKCTLGLREEENDTIGEFLCIIGHYMSSLRASQPPLTKMRDQWDHFLPGSNQRNVECMFRADGFRCSMSGNYYKATLRTVTLNPFMMHWPEVIYSKMYFFAILSGT